MLGHERQENAHLYSYIHLYVYVWQRVVFFAFFTMVVLLLTVAAQSFYLRAYFRYKKII